MLKVDDAFLKSLKEPPKQAVLIEGGEDKHPMTDQLVEGLDGPQRAWHSVKVQRFLQQLQRQLPA